MRSFEEHDGAMSRARAEWQDAFDLVYTPDDDDRKKLRSSLQDMEAETWKLKKRESSETLAGAKTTIGDLQQFEDPSRAIFQQLAPIRSVAQHIYSTSASTVSPHLIPPAAWWKVSKPVIRDSLAGHHRQNGGCDFDRYKTMGRRQPLHITYHPRQGVCSDGGEFSERRTLSELLRILRAENSPGASDGGEFSQSFSERLLCMLEDAGLESSLEYEFESGDPHLMIGSLAVVMPVSPEYIYTSRFQRTLQRALGLGKYIVPILVTPDSIKTIFDDPNVGPTMQTMRCIDLSGIFSGGGDSERSDSEWNMLMQRLQGAVGHNGPVNSKDGDIFISYCTRNSEIAAKYGATPGFVGSMWADPRKVKDGLEGKGFSCWVDCENNAFLAHQGLFNGVDAAMRRSELVVVCMSNEYMASETCRNELHHAVVCLQKPVLLVLVGSTKSVGRDARWDKFAQASLLERRPFVDLRGCKDMPDFDRKLHEMHVKIHECLGLETPIQQPLMRVRVSHVSFRENALIGDHALAFVLKVETVGETRYKSKSHHSQLAPQNAPAATPAKGGPPKGGPPKGGTAAEDGEVRIQKIEWRDKFKFDCRVDESLRVTVFCTLAHEHSSGEAADTKKKDGGDKKLPLPRNPAQPDKGTDETEAPALKKGEVHFVGEAVVRLRTAHDIQRTSTVQWHPLADLSKGGIGASAYAGKVGLRIETVDFSAARAPKPPIPVADVECQTDPVRPAPSKAKGKELPLPRKKSRFAERLGADRGDAWPKPPTVQKEAASKVKQSLGIHPKYRDGKLFDFDTAPLDQGGQNEYWLKMRDGIQSLLGLKAPGDKTTQTSNHQNTQTDGQ